MFERIRMMLGKKVSAKVQRLSSGPANSKPLEGDIPMKEMVKPPSRDALKDSEMFFRAADAGDAEALLLYLPHVDPKARRAFDGRTALHVAVWRGHVDCVELLLPASGEVVLDAKSRMPPAAIAAQESHVEVLRLILNHAPEAAHGVLGRIALAHAIQACGADCVRLLIQAGCGLGLDDIHESPLHQAVQIWISESCNSKGLDCIREVLLHVDPDLEDAHGFTALKYARQGPPRAAKVIEAMILAKKEKELLAASTLCPTDCYADAGRSPSL